MNTAELTVEINGIKGILSMVTEYIQSGQANEKTASEKLDTVLYTAELLIAKLAKLETQLYTE